MGDIAITIGNGADASASAVTGIGDFAFADGANSTADAGYIGNFDSAVVFGANSSADAGFGYVDPFPVFGSIFVDINHNFDLAGVFGDTLTATATSGSDLVDIVP
ncbi:MAG: hypothetical protein WBV80_22725 [Mycobacterium sp.]